MGHCHGHCNFSRDTTTFYWLIFLTLSSGWLLLSVKESEQNYLDVMFIIVMSMDIGPICMLLIGVLKIILCWELDASELVFESYAPPMDYTNI